MSKDNPGIIEEAAKDALDYVNLKIDSFKLGIMENLSTFFSTLFSVVVCILLFHIALVFLFAALAWWMSELVGSIIGGCLIIGGFFLVAGFIVFLLRKKLIVSPVVRMFANMMSDIMKKSSDDE